ncbi:MAG: peptidoglycan-binding protein [Clostridium sp.]
MKGKKIDGKKAIVIQNCNEKVDLKKIKNKGIDAVVLKVPCSIKWNKKNTQEICNKAKKENLLVGIVVEVDLEKSVNLQAMLIGNIIKKINPDIYPVIEVNKNEGINKKMFSDKCLKLLDRVKEGLNFDCILKSEIEFANKNLDIRLRNTMFWVVDKEKEKPRNSRVWSGWSCFSYSDKFLVGEINFEISEIKECVILNPVSSCDCGHCNNHEAKQKEEPNKKDGKSSNKEKQGTNKIVKKESSNKNKTETKNGNISNPYVDPVINPVSKCESMKGFIQGEIVERLQEQLDIQFKAGLKVNGCFTQETLDKCILIMKNASGPITKIVQERLEANGFSVGPTGIDGMYNKYTIAAVKRFQKKYGLKVTGVVNKNTWRELFLKR